MGKEWIADAKLCMEQELPSLWGMQVQQGGEVLFEAYGRHRRATDYMDWRSATKSVTAMLVGIAISQGFIPGTEARIAPYLPEYEAAMRPSFKDMTVGDLLRMQSDMPWASDSWLVEEPVAQWHQSADWIKYVLERPGYREGTEAMAEMPEGAGGEGLGTGGVGVRYPFRYCSADSYLLGVVVARAAGMTLQELALRYLLRPLGIPKLQWEACPAGYALGHVGLRLPLPAMAKLGVLVANQGRHGTSQLIPASWVRQMATPHNEGYPSHGAYGYHWWIASHERGPIVYAAGAGGQYVAVQPQTASVITVAAKPRGRNWPSAFPLIRHIFSQM